jgi:3-oxoacyl-(acyl-carrier-protein) synthase
LTGLAMAGAPCEPYRFTPDRQAIERAVRGALDDAGVSPGQIDLLLPSRNGVVEMDRAEEEVLGLVFETAPPAVSVKDAIGEMAAAGGGQIVAACRALAGAEGVLTSRPRRVLIDSFGAGGNFLAAVFEAAP